MILFIRSALDDLLTGDLRPLSSTNTMLREMSMSPKGHVQKAIEDMSCAKADLGQQDVKTRKAAVELFKPQSKCVIL